MLTLRQQTLIKSYRHLQQPSQGILHFKFEFEKNQLNQCFKNYTKHKFIEIPGDLVTKVLFLLRGVIQ